MAAVTPLTSWADMSEELWATATVALDKAEKAETAAQSEPATTGGKGHNGKSEYAMEKRKEAINAIDDIAKLFDDKRYELEQTFKNVSGLSDKLNEIDAIISNFRGNLFTSDAPIKDLRSEAEKFNNLIIAAKKMIPNEVKSAVREAQADDNYKAAKAAFEAAHAGEVALPSFLGTKEATNPEQVRRVIGIKIGKMTPEQKKGVTIDQMIINYLEEKYKGYVEKVFSKKAKGGARRRRTGRKTRKTTHRKRKTARKTRKTRKAGRKHLTFCVTINFAPSALILKQTQPLPLMKTRIWRAGFSICNQFAMWWGKSKGWRSLGPSSCTPLLSQP